MKPVAVRPVTGAARFVCAGGVPTDVLAESGPVFIRGVLPEGRGQYVVCGTCRESVARAPRELAARPFLASSASGGRQGRQ